MVESGDELPVAPYGLFFDLQTGIPLPNESVKKPTISYAPLRFIVEENARVEPKYTICFHQGIDHRFSLRGQDGEHRVASADSDEHEYHGKLEPHRLGALTAGAGASDMFARP